MHITAYSVAGNKLLLTRTTSQDTSNERIGPTPGAVAGTLLRPAVSTTSSNAQDKEPRIL